MSREISDVEMQDRECCEMENEDDSVNLKNDESFGLVDSEVNDDSDLRRSSRGRVRAIPARFRDSEFYLGMRKKSGESRDCGRKKGRKRVESDDLDDIRCDLSLSLVNCDDEIVMALNKSVEEKERKDKKAEKMDFYRPENFEVGDVVWAKYSRNAIAWPAVVIDPLDDAPESVLDSCAPNTTCVMFFGYSKKGIREYGWIRQRLIYPYAAYLDRFQRKVPSSSSQSTDFLKAVEEAILYDFGCNGACDVVGHKPNHDSTASRHFDKLCKSKQYCWICKKIWHQSNSGNWLVPGGFPDMLYITCNGEQMEVVFLLLSLQSPGKCKCK